MCHLARNSRQFLASCQSEMTSISGTSWFKDIFWFSLSPAFLFYFVVVMIADLVRLTFCTQWYQVVTRKTEYIVPYSAYLGQNSVPMGWFSRLTMKRSKDRLLSEGTQGTEGHPSSDSAELAHTPPAIGFSFPTGPEEIYKCWCILSSDKGVHV